MKPTVSVIMNCYNSDAFLKEAIDSVYAQTMSDWEIIFFDNNSTDNSADIANSYDKKIHYMRGNKTLPLGAARNVAINKAQGKYLAFLDCDDLWMPTKLEKQVASMESKISSRNPGISYTDAMRIDEKGLHLMLYSTERTLFSGNVYFQLIRDCFIACSTCLVDRKAFNFVGGFNNNYKQVEDLDLWLRIAKFYDVVLINELLTKIRVHRANQSRDIFSFVDEKILMIEKLKSDNKEVLSECDRVLKELQVRKTIAKLFNLNNKNLFSIVSKFFSLLFYCISHPKVSFYILKRYCTLSMFKLYKYKFLK